jgi:hypothetical protein
MHSGASSFLLLTKFSVTMGEEMGVMGSTRKWHKKCEVCVNKKVMLKCTIIKL